MVAPSKLSDQFVVRLPDGMREAVRASAKANERTMNAEIIFHLRKALGMAAGEEPGRGAPAAGSDKAALQGGSI